MANTRDHQFHALLLFRIARQFGPDARLESSQTKLEWLGLVNSYILAMDVVFGASTSLVQVDSPKILNAPGTQVLMTESSQAVSSDAAPIVRRLFIQKWTFTTGSEARNRHHLTFRRAIIEVGVEPAAVDPCSPEVVSRLGLLNFPLEKASIC
jgi:hypothetical protein